jgi:GDP-L-fucose synthase
LEKDSRIYIAGHKGLVGSTLLRKLQAEGYTDLITRTHKELDLERQAEVDAFFDDQRPDYVFLAAARVGGIWANSQFPGEFIYQNLIIQTNVIHASWKVGVKRLLFLGSSCIYPRECPQPMKEEHLLTSSLEPTNQPYAVAKITGIIHCEAYNRQYGTCFLAAMPNNLYGPNDNFDLQSSHVLPAMIRKFHLAGAAAQGGWKTIACDEARYGSIPDEFRASLAAIAHHHGHSLPGSFQPSASCPLPPPSMVIWGTGKPLREFLHVDDLADACLFLINLEDEKFRSLITVHSTPLINIGYGKEISIKELAELIKDTVGFEGAEVFDHTKPDGTPRKLLDVSGLTALGWSPKITLREGIKDTYDWYQNSLLESEACQSQGPRS